MNAALSRDNEELRRNNREQVLRQEAIRRDEVSNKLKKTPQAVTARLYTMMSRKSLIFRENSKSAGVEKASLTSNLRNMTEK